ncbi:MAG: radical SAM protein [Deltaproteobacteria bacterium]
MGRCRLCEDSSPFISGELGVCVACIRNRPGDALSVTAAVHEENRKLHDLPVRPPKDPDGVSCNLCVHECRIPEGGFGFCGLRRNEGGALRGADASLGKLSWYHDPLPTNCVADRVCAGGTGAGHPVFAHRPGPERGYRNLAVFFHACSLNCLSCQNWTFRLESMKPADIPVDALAGAADLRTSCVCFFGGDPAPQLPFSLKAARQARARNPGRILRICWETNGTMHPALCDGMLDLAIESGGCVKFDLKARDEALHIALTGVTNRRTLENFARAAKRIPERPVPPPLVAGTLLVPGYVDETEVSAIASFLASLDRTIPYSLLAFHPTFQLFDLPRTPERQAVRCLEAARGAGLETVHLGNTHLLA